mmetsp:Transcript_6485/g.14177  ORF Transcript_6485/g.14177 Transcript_6485/m.14177 type:complete len:413 (-) Transcript_6485:92-1330(-)
MSEAPKKAVVEEKAKAAPPVDDEPEPAEWQDDAQAAACTSCEGGFGLLRWRHHCRSCGLIFCDACLPHTSPVPAPAVAPGADVPKEKDLLRVCKDCFQELEQTVKQDPSTFGAATTGDAAAQGYDLTGKTVLVTGANTGIGKETARVLAARGATVIITGRNKEKLATAVEDIKKISGNDQVTGMPLDLERVQSVKDFAKAFFAEEKERTIDILILNAGTFGTPKPIAEDVGLEATFAINHVGHFALTKLLMDALKRARDGARVVVLSSHSHYQPNSFDLEGLKAGKTHSTNEAYGQSKLANVLFAHELHKRHAAEFKGDVFSVHPGAMIATDVARNITGGSVFMTLLSPFTKSISQGSSTTVRAAVDETLKGRGHEYMADCQFKKPSAAATPEMAQKLWEWSEELFAKHYKE